MGTIAVSFSGAASASASSAGLSVVDITMKPQVDDKYVYIEKLKKAHVPVVEAIKAVNNNQLHVSSNQLDRPLLKIKEKKGKKKKKKRYEKKKKKGSY